MSASDTNTDDKQQDSPRSTYAINYEAKAALPEDVDLSQTDAVTAVTESLAAWSSDSDGQAARVREFRGVEYDPQRPALGISLRVSSIPENAPPDVGYNAIQTLLDDLGATLGVAFGSARDVGVIR